MRSFIIPRSQKPTPNISAMLGSIPRSIRYPVLYELGFEEAIEWLTEQIEERHGLSVSYENDDEPKPLREEVKILLFHAVRELLVNVVKHAQSNCAGVVLKRTS